MNEPPRRNRAERLPLTPGIANSLDEEDEMITLGPLLIVLGLGAVILLLVVIAVL
jgi:preprotein translocase subunit Sec61beta